MSAEALLASLMAQAEGRGVDLVTLRALVEESSQAGARRALALLGLDDPSARRDMDELRELLSAWRALASLGLDDPSARRDMDELRELLSAWRDAKRSAWRAVVTWAVRLVLAALLAGMAFKLGLPELLHG